MRQLTIVFDGVVAVGPGAPPEGTRKGPFFGVMPRSARQMSDRTHRLVSHGIVGEPCYYTAIHVPTIFTQMKPAVGSRPPDQILQLSPLHERWYLWHPLRERLEFQFDGTSKVGDLEYLQDPSALPGHGGPMNSGTLSFHDIKCVPDMSRIWPERSVLLPGLLSAGTGINEKVVTQVLVPRGKVVGAELVDRTRSQSAVFDPPRACHDEKVVPNTAVIVDDINSVGIAAFSLDSGEELDSIKLEMTDDAEIWVSNGDPSDVEVVMERLAMQIIERLIKGKKWKPSDEALNYLAFLAQIFGRSIDVEWIEQYIRHHHHGYDRIHQGIARDLQRTGDHDIDFELFYSILRNDDLAHDGVGLPVPKCHRASQDLGPDCYNCGCHTKDYLCMKSP